MANYPISNLDHGRFEELIQALAKCEIASNVTPFSGGGADGGREAICEGKMNYPSPKPWDGYLVIQCKFCEHPRNDPGADGRWALRQLKNELKVFETGRRRMP